jgi:hypothetical protein
MQLHCKTDKRSAAVVVTCAEQTEGRDVYRTALSTRAEHRLTGMLGPKRRE